MKISPLFTALILAYTMSSCNAAGFREWLLQKAGANHGEVLHFPFAFEETASLESFLERHDCSSHGVSLSGGSPPAKEVSDAQCRSMEFDGTGSGLVVNEWRAVPFQDKVSVGVWIKPEYSMFQESKASRFIVSKSASNESGFFISVTADRGISAAINCASGFVVAKVVKVLEPHRWHHVGFSWNGAALQIYLDGRKAGEPVEAQAPYRDYTKASLTFGRPSSVDTQNYRGNIGEFILCGEAYDDSAE